MRATGRILVSAPDDPAAVADPQSEILVFASDDERTIMRKLVVKQAKYIRYRATEQLRVTNESFPGDPYFRGKECEFIDGLSSYDPVTGEGKWGYTGTVTQVEPGRFWRRDRAAKPDLARGDRVYRKQCVQ